jgi:hypothetical protein
MKNNQSSLLIEPGLIAVLILACQPVLYGAEMTRNEVQSFFGKYSCGQTTRTRREPDSSLCSTRHGIVLSESPQCFVHD